MKRIVLSLVIVVLLGACGVFRNLDVPDQTVELSKDVESTDSVEYELIILDPKFESFLATKPSANFYSQHYYENWNKRYVIEWNLRHGNPLRYGDFYQTRIHYEPDRVDYGLDLNYRLYYYFQFIEQEYGIRLIRRRGS